MKVPSQVGSDAIRLQDAHWTTYYDKKITYALESPNRFLWRNLLGVENKNSPGLRGIEWNYEVGPFGMNHSVWGLEPKNMNILFTPVTNKFHAFTATLDLEYYLIERAKLGGLNLEAETVRAIANKLDWYETYYLLHGLTEATDSDEDLDGILDFTGVQDAGNPTGAWDDPTDVHADIQTICGKLDAIGYDGPIDLVMDSGLKAGFRGFIDDGTTTFETLVIEWMKKQLNGGRVLFNDYAFVDPATQMTGVDYAATVTAGANHYCLAFGRHEMNKVVLSHDTMPFEREPRRKVDMLRDYTLRTTIQIGSPLHVVFMDAIDEST